MGAMQLGPMVQPTNTFDPSAAVHMAMTSPQGMAGNQAIQGIIDQRAAHAALMQRAQQTLGNFLMNLGQQSQQPAQFMPMQSLPPVQATPWQMHMPTLMRGPGGY